MPEGAATSGRLLEPSTFSSRFAATHEEEAGRLDRELREHVAAQGPDSRPEEIDAETLERLRQLGYVE